MNKRRIIIIIVFLIIACIPLALYLFRNNWSNSNTHIHRFLTDPSSRSELVTDMAEPCPNAPFLLPTSGFIGLLYDDPALPYNPLRRHQGIDIFGDGEANQIPIYAAYDGYLTREDDWLSTVIIRHDDPLQPGRTIWTYYTHMASRDGSTDFISKQYPRGTQDMYVEQGTLLGYQGEYAGVGATGIALHVHFSIVLSNDDGSYKNEAVKENTLDPSPYFGMEMNFSKHPELPITCNS